MRIVKTIWGFFCALAIFLLPFERVDAEEIKGNDLYAISAALIDAQTGRVLYGKNCDEQMAMASTTKIMTCIVILENLDLGEEAEVSAYASSMPKVKLNVQKGEKYTIRNLLFSLMLESHNDSAVVLAEHLGKRYLTEELKNKSAADFSIEESKQAVAQFARLMNEEAREIGCMQTYFLTPNGLDATETITLNDGRTMEKEHCTTAAELAKIMAYCVLKSPKRDLFREITGASNYTFTENGRTISCNNHNAFLSMMDGAFSGKTGFTNKAGYCYVGALERDGRTYIVSLLACGWPNNKKYKWSDTMKLMSYGVENYFNKEFMPETQIPDIVVFDGASYDGNPYKEVRLNVERQGGVLPITMLSKNDESVFAEIECKSELSAPITERQNVGMIKYYFVDSNGVKLPIATEDLYIDKTVDKKDYLYMLKYVWRGFLVF